MLLVQCIALSLSAVADVAQLSTDFSLGTNPFNGWELGFKSTRSGAFTHYGASYHGDAYGNTLAYWGARPNTESWIRQNLGPDSFTAPGQGTFPVHGISAAPGYFSNPDNFAVARYVIPSDGTYSIKVWGSATGLNGVRVFVLQDNWSLLNTSLQPGQSTGFTNEQFYVSGTVLEVLTGRAPNSANYGAVLQFDAQIENVGSPETLPPELSFTPSRGTFDDELQVQCGLNVGRTGDIRYMLDGQEPNSQSTVYHGAIHLRDSAYVRAALFDGDSRISKIYGAVFQSNASVDGSVLNLPFANGLASRFSAIANPTNDWSFGYKQRADGRFQIYKEAFSGDAAGNVLAYWGVIPNTESWVRQNRGPLPFTVYGQGTFPVGGLSCAPGFLGHLDNFAVSRYQVPSSGIYRVTIAGYDSGIAEIDVHILQDGVDWLHKTLNPSEGLQLKADRFFAAGTWIDIAVGRGSGDSNYGAIFQFDASIDPLSTDTEPPFKLSFDPALGFFTNEMVLHIQKPVGDGEIRYTLDGTAPGSDSALYIDSLNLDQSSIVTAAVFINGQRSSSVYTGAYHRITNPEDGIPYTWYLGYFGSDYLNNPNATETADPDQDGSSNFKEYLGHSDPTNPLSGFAVDLKTIPCVFFKSVPGKTYKISRREGFTSPLVELGRVTATGTTLAFPDPNASAGIGFYVVEVVTE